MNNSNQKQKKFEPIGGFPPLIRLPDNIDEKNIETRSKPNKNIVNIKNIINTKKKDVFIKFGIGEDDANNFVDSMSARPNEYENIEYDDLSKDFIYRNFREQ